MADRTWIGHENGGVPCPSSRKHVAGLACCLLLFLTVCGSWAQAQWPRVVPSGDGTPTAYEVAGAGEPTLVFVHG